MSLFNFGETSELDDWFRVAVDPWILDYQMLLSWVALVLKCEFYY
uniref:Uncharacterized protein n=1 Tax=Microplitis mediator bracovirus TaxID=1836595 RepID=A0A2I6SGX1_9VIRU|nr:hypothetical protein MmBV_COP2 [Microplitis mediator bracovirus]